MAAVVTDLTIDQSTATARDVNHIHVLEDYVEGSLNYLPTEFLREQPNLTAFIEVFLNRLKEVDKVAVGLAEKRLLGNATGVYLDEIGKQLGIFRNGLGDEDYRAIITILNGTANKHGTRPEVISVLRQLLGEEAFQTYKGFNYRFDINISSSCFDNASIVQEIKDMLPLVTYLRITESMGFAFGFKGDDMAIGFSTRVNRPVSGMGGWASLVYYSKTE